MSMAIAANAASARADAAACLGVVVLAHIGVLAVLPASQPPVPGVAAAVTVTLLAPPEPPAALEAPVAAVEKPRQFAPKPTAKPLAANAERLPAATRSTAVPMEAPAPVETEPAAPSAAGAAPAAIVPPAASAAQAAASDRTKAPPPLVPAQYHAAYLDNPKPEYPRLARRLGEQGTVLLNVYVDAGGRPEKIALHTSSGSPRLDQAARETVSRWKFIPARQGERPVGAWLVVPITFVLEG